MSLIKKIILQNIFELEISKDHFHYGLLCACLTISFFVHVFSWWIEIFGWAPLTSSISLLIGDCVLLTTFGWKSRTRCSEKGQGPIDIVCYNQLQDCQFFLYVVSLSQVIMHVHYSKIHLV